MKNLSITWQRLVDDSGSTCPRCAGTQQEMQRAADRLCAALEPLGVQPVLETREIAPATFMQRPDQSNRIWIGGRPLEDRLGYEVIPEALVVRAGLIAASQLLDPTLSLPLSA